MTINLKSLIAKLDTPTRKAMESAANVALSRTHHEVDIEHVLLELLAASDSELLRILKAYRIDAQRLQADLLTSLEHFRMHRFDHQRLHFCSGRPYVFQINRLVGFVKTQWFGVEIDIQRTGQCIGHHQWR